MMHNGRTRFESRMEFVMSWNVKVYSFTSSCACLVFAWCSPSVRQNMIVELLTRRWIVSLSDPRSMLNEVVREAEIQELRVPPCSWLFLPLELESLSDKRSELSLPGQRV
jgi:hypothetical protein